MKNISKTVIIFFLIFICSFKAHSAEILQINRSNIILVGDQNRNLIIKLYCVDVNEDFEQRAVNFLKKEFPRGSKVKIKPVGYDENILIAKIFDITGSKEMSDLLISNDLTNEVCKN